MNRREMLRLSLAAALMGTPTNPNEAQATQTVAAKPISLPALPPKPPKDIAETSFFSCVAADCFTCCRGAFEFFVHVPHPQPLKDFDIILSDVVRHWKLI
jgi:hypothetical protein